MQGQLCLEQHTIFPLKLALHNQIASFWDRPSAARLERADVSSPTVFFLTSRRCACCRGRSPARTPSPSFVKTPLPWRAPTAWAFALKAQAFPAAKSCPKPFPSEPCRSRRAACRFSCSTTAAPWAATPNPPFCTRATWAARPSCAPARGCGSCRQRDKSCWFWRYSFYLWLLCFETSRLRHELD